MNLEQISSKWNRELPGLHGVRRFYHEGDDPPQIDKLDFTVDKILQRLTKGKLKVWTLHAFQHQCPICKGNFWSEKKVDNNPCYRGRQRFKGPPPCYIKFYGDTNGREEKPQETQPTPNIPER